MEDSESIPDICRVCRCEGTPDRVLFHPCVCTGSIRYIHQDCLVQWLKYSKKEYCELCKHRFTFTPIYSPDMPKRLPLRDVIGGLASSVGRAVNHWLHYTLVAFSWLGVVPLTACRIYRCLFTGSLSSLLTLPLDMLSTENLLTDCIQGCFIVGCSLCAFISLVWIREQIVHGGGPDWLEPDPELPGANPQLNLWERGFFNMAGGFMGAARHHAAPAPNAAPADGDEQDVGEEVEVDGEGVVEVDNADLEDNNWNAMDWDRAAEELTWERLLGLDGSLFFLEHVFWVVSLNTLLILMFAFLPYHSGRITLRILQLSHRLESSHFEGLLTALVGYVTGALSTVILLAVFTLFRFKKFHHYLGLCYIIFKVMLLVVGEIGVFPLICGWWLDICSLSMFDASIKDRIASYNYAPGTSMFVHWLIGMVYAFYFASFILLLKEVLRPGVLWILRNVNDPDFSPIQEMISLPVYRHVRRFFVSIIIFGSTVLVIVWLPVRTIRRLSSSFLPYNVYLSNEAPVSELSLELLLLQVVLPALLEQGHTRRWFKVILRQWTSAVAWLLDLKSYLLGDESHENEGGAIPAPAPNHNQALAPIEADDGGLGAAHQAFLQAGGPSVVEPYHKPSFFVLRLIALVVLVSITMFCVSLLALVTPVFVGRRLMSLWMGDTKVHELYTATCGLYSCWLMARVVTVLYQWLPKGTAVILRRLQQWAVLGVKVAVVSSVLLGLVPLLLGLLFDLVFIIPLRVRLDQSPLFFPWQEWALGILQTKIICAVSMMVPNWWLKNVMDQIYHDGLRNLNLGYVLRRLCIPVTFILGMSLAVPYIIAHSIVPAFGLPFETQTLIARQIYPFVLFCLICNILFSFQLRQFYRFYEHVKNDKYLVGQRLLNYNDTKRRQREITNNAAIM